MSKIRVIVADDSITVRKRVVEILESDPQLEIVGEANDGKQAVELCERLKPDVVTLDMMMPNMTGLDATEHIMAYCPTPILIVSSSMNRGELFKTYDALAAGAVDVLDKSKATESDEFWERILIAKVKVVSRIRVITHPKRSITDSKRVSPGRASPTLASNSVSPVKSFDLVAIGASTGGPAAIQEILRSIPPTFPLPILFILHISEPFGATFAQWLNSNSNLPVFTASDGDPLPRPGERKIIVPPTNRHLIVQQGRLKFDYGPERHSCRPSVDVLFESVAKEIGSRAIGCLLTGMGKDGAEGLLAIRKKGGLTIAQDESSSVVFGMPREAVNLGAASYVLPLNEIGPALVRFANEQFERRRVG